MLMGNLQFSLKCLGPVCVILSGISVDVLLTRDSPWPLLHGCNSRAVPVLPGLVEIFSDTYIPASAQSGGAAGREMQRDINLSGPRNESPG